MKKTLVLLAFSLLAPAAAGAQAVPPVARSWQAANGHGITVNGTSVLRVPASSAHIALNLSSIDNKNTLNQEALAPLVDALVNAGAERSTVQLPISFSAGGYSNYATVTAVVQNPTIATMRTGIASVGAAVAGMKNVRLNMAQVLLKNADCAQAMAKARADAISGARLKALAIAKQLGVSLGGVSNVNAFDQTSPDGSCSSQYVVGAMGAQFGPGSDNSDADYVTVSVASNVTITYGIK